MQLALRWVTDLKPSNSRNVSRSMSLNRWTRKLHRWGAIITLIPLALVIGTGLLLQLKKQITWVQPATAKGTEAVPQLSFEEILSVAKQSENAEIQSWEDVDRLDVRPGKGIVKVRSNNRWELQIDTATGELLASSYRRSDLIESLHDGSFFSDFAKVWLFFPNGLILLGLWATGFYLWLLPFLAKRKSRLRKKKQREAVKPPEDK